MIDRRTSTDKHLRCFFFSVLLASASLAGAQQATTYKQTNIISDGAVPALVTDPNYVDPWGISIGPEFWINASCLEGSVAGSVGYIIKSRLGEPVPVPDAGGMLTVQ